MIVFLKGGIDSRTVEMKTKCTPHIYLCQLTNTHQDPAFLLCHYNNFGAGTQTSISAKGNEN